MRDQIVAAMRGLRIIELTDAVGRTRVIEPHAIVTTTRRKLCVHGYQTDGYSSSGDLPEWRNLPIDDFQSMRETGSAFTPRADFSPETSSQIAIVHERI